MISTGNPRRLDTSETPPEKLWKPFFYLDRIFYICRVKQIKQKEKIMNKEFIPYEQALALKELGFDEPCYDAYTLKGGGESTVPPERYNHREDVVAAPLYQQAFRWFREKYGLYQVVGIDSPPITHYYTITKLMTINEHTGLGVQAEQFNIISYEGAELECLLKLIEIVKTK